MGEGKERVPLQSPCLSRPTDPPCEEAGSVPHLRSPDNTGETLHQQHLAHLRVSKAWESQDRYFKI